MRRLAEANSVKNVRIYNPDVDDFTVKYEGEPYTIHALDIQEYPHHIAQHIKKHLADHLLWKRGIKVNPQDDLTEIYKEIEVEL